MRLFQLLSSDRIWVDSQLSGSSMGRMSAYSMKAHAPTTLGCIFQ